MFGKSSSNEPETGNDFTKLKQKLETKAGNHHPIEIRILNYEDLSCERNYSEFLSKLKIEPNSKEQSDVNAVDLLLCFVDEDEIKMRINSACNKVGLAWMDCGFGTTNQIGHVRLIRPGESACLLVSKIAYLFLRVVCINCNVFLVSSKSW